jgi:hypothetical protein
LPRSRAARRADLSATQSPPMQMQRPPAVYHTAHGSELVTWVDGVEVGRVSARRLPQVILEAAKALKNE